MDEEFDNPLDDELLKELGLEPKTKPAPKAKPARPAEGKPPPEAATAAQPRKPAPPVSRPQTAPPQSPPDESFERGLKNLAHDMPVTVMAVLGKRTMTLKDVISLKQGEIMELKKLPQESIDLVANGRLVARGDLVLVDGKLGIQIKQLVG